MLIKNATPAARQRQIKLFALLYKGLCQSYGSEKALSQWLSAATETLEHTALRSCLEYYSLVVQAHLQKCGNLFGHLEREGAGEKEQGIESMLASRQGPPQLPEYRLAVLLLKVAHLKGAQYRTLSHYADGVGMAVAGSILRRMHAEETEAIVLLENIVTKLN